MRDALRDLIGEAAQKKVLIGNVNNGSDVGGTSLIYFEPSLN